MSDPQEPEFFDVLGDPDDYAAMPDAQLVSLAWQGDAEAMLELQRRA